MEWLIAGIFIAIVIYKVFYKEGNYTFWNAVKKWENKNLAYQFFINNSCWHVVDGIHNSSPPEDKKNWDGPLIFVTESAEIIKLYGKVGEYEKSQDYFMKILKDSKDKKIMRPDEVNDPYFQKWYESHKTAIKIKGKYDLSDIFMSELTGKNEFPKLKLAEEKLKEARSAFIKNCCSRHDIKSILDSSGKNEKWIDEFFNRFENGGMPIAGALIIRDSGLLNRYFSYLSRDDWSEEDAFLQIFMDTGAIDNKLQDGKIL